MQHTTNYNLNKPDVEDRADINDLNENMDIIDSALTDKVGDVSFVNFNQEGDQGVRQTGTLIVDGVGTPVFTRDTNVLQFDIARDDKARGILFSTSSSEGDVECNGVYKAQSHLSYNLDDSVLKLTSLAANYNHISITPSDIQLSGHPAGGTWDGTNASLVAAISDKLDKLGGNLGGTLVTADGMTALRPNSDMNGQIGSNTFRYSSIHSVNFVGNLTGGIQQIVRSRDNAEYPIIMSDSADTTQGTYSLRKVEPLTYNPQYSRLTINDAATTRCNIIDGDGLQHHELIGCQDEHSQEVNVDNWSQLKSDDVVLHTEDSTLAPNTWDGTNTSLKQALTSSKESVKVNQISSSANETPVILLGDASVGPLNRGTLMFKPSTYELKNGDGTNILSISPTDISLYNSTWYRSATSLKSALADVSYYSSQSVLQEEDTSTPGSFEVILSGSNQSTSRTESVRKSNNLRYSPTDNRLSILGASGSIQLEPDYEVTFVTANNDTYQFQDNGIFSIYDAHSNVAISGLGADFQYTDASDNDYGVSIRSMQEDITLLNSTWDGTHSSLKDTIASIIATLQSLQNS